MPQYNCPRCGYNTIDRTRYINHLKRKNICENIYSDDLNNEYIKYNISCKISNKSNIPKKSSKYTHSLREVYPENTQFIPNTSSPKRDKWECDYCGKELSSYKNLWRHLKTCKEKVRDEEEKSNLMSLIEMLNEQLKEKDQQLNEEIKKRDAHIDEELRKRDKQIDEQNKQINELIKKAGITQNIQQNIKILAYKNTDLSHLTDQDYLQCLNRSNMCIPNLIKKIHFNPKKPENHNIYISNIKNKYIMIYDGGKWNLHNQNDTIDDLIDTNQFVLEQKLEEWLENGKEFPEIMKKFNRYLEKKEKDDVINKIKEEIKLVLFNNRKSIDI